MDDDYDNHRRNNDDWHLGCVAIIMIMALMSMPPSQPNPNPKVVMLVVIQLVIGLQNTHYILQRSPPTNMTTECDVVIDSNWVPHTTRFMMKKKEQHPQTK